MVLPLNVQLDDRNVFAPDLLWYAEARSPSRGDRPPYPMPDLAVEIRSPSTWRYDVGSKKSRYERGGLRELWLVDTDAEAVLVFRRLALDAAAFDVALELGGDDRIGSSLLPGFSLRVNELFPPT